MTFALQADAAEKPRPHNVILFVPDGLRALKVTPETAPAMAEVRDKGVNFTNPHSLFPTFTTANASGMATGHYVGDTGDFSNTIYSGFPVAHAGGSLTPFLENDAVLGDVDANFAGDYLDEDTMLKAARARGMSTAAIGKVGPALIFDHTERSGQKTILIDDATGSSSGIALSDDTKAKLTAAGLPLTAPSRGDNGKTVTNVANVAQQAYFADVTTKVVLPMFKDRNQPFVLVFWSRDPDGTQHNQGDSLNQLMPGINGPTSLAAIKNADDNLRQIRQALNDLGLDRNDRHHHCRGPRLLHHLQGEQHQRGRKGGLSQCAEGHPALRLPRHRSRQDARPAAVRPGQQKRRGRRQCVSEPRQRSDRPGCGQARCRGCGERRLGPDLSAQPGPCDGATGSSDSCCSRIMSAGCSSTTAWAVIPARCRSRRSI